MKMNGEDLSVLKEKKTKKTLLKLMIIFIIVVIIFFLLEFFFIFKMKSDYYFNQEILENGQKYEKSIYIKYKDKIYAYVYGEAYQLDNVDIESFKVIDSMDYFDSHVAVDKKLVYFGNIPIPDLNPVFHKRLDSSTVTDAFFLDYINDEESIFYNLPQDKVPFYY